MSRAMLKMGWRSRAPSVEIFCSTHPSSHTSGSVIICIWNDARAIDCRMAKGVGSTASDWILTWIGVALGASEGEMNENTPMR